MSVLVHWVIRFLKLYFYQQVLNGYAQQWQFPESVAIDLLLCS